MVRRLTGSDIAGSSLKATERLAVTIRQPFLLIMGRQLQDMVRKVGGRGRRIWPVNYFARHDSRGPAVASSVESVELQKLENGNMQTLQKRLSRLIRGRWEEQVVLTSCIRHVILPTLLYLNLTVQCAQVS